MEVQRLPFVETMVRWFSGHPIPYGSLVFKYGSTEYPIGQISDKAVFYGVEGYTLDVRSDQYFISKIILRRKVLFTRCEIYIRHVED